MTTFNRLPEKPNVPPPLHKLSNELARIGVIYKSLDQLTLPAKSLRVHSPSQIKKISRSLSVFGFLIPIVIDHPVSSITQAEVEVRAAQVALQAPKVWLGN